MEKRVFSQMFCCKQCHFTPRKCFQIHANKFSSGLQDNFLFESSKNFSFLSNIFTLISDKNILPRIRKKQILQHFHAWVCLLICILLHKLCIYKNATKAYHTVNILYFPYLLSIYHLQKVFTDV